MYGKRTDLAVEEQELRQENAQDGAPLSGVVSETRTQRGFPLTTVRIEDESAAKELCKPTGTYVTMEAGRLLRRESGAPYFALTGPAAAWAAEQGVTVHLSLTHERGLANAIVILEKV